MSIPANVFSHYRNQHSILYQLAIFPLWMAGYAFSGTRRPKRSASIPTARHGRSQKTPNSSHTKQYLSPMNRSPSRIFPGSRNSLQSMAGSYSAPVWHGRSEPISDSGGGPPLRGLLSSISSNPQAYDRTIGWNMRIAKSRSLGLTIPTFRVFFQIENEGKEDERVLLCWIEEISTADVITEY